MSPPLQPPKRSTASGPCGCAARHAVGNCSGCLAGSIPAASGAEALAVLERDQNVDLLFTDVVMPGQPTARALAARALEMRPGLKVLFVSGYFEGMLIDREQLGADVEFLPKHIEKRSLLKK